MFLERLDGLLSLDSNLGVGLDSVVRVTPLVRESLGLRQRESFLAWMKLCLLEMEAIVPLRLEEDLIS